MAYINNNKIKGFGGIKRAYLNNTLIFQSFYKVVEEEPKMYINYDLNNQWEDTTSLTVDGHIVLKSFSNYHDPNSVSRMRIHIYGYDSITFKIYSDGESRYDYTLIGNLDYDFSNVSSSVSNTTTGIKTTTIGNQKKWIDVAYTITEPDVEHFIDVLYRKDGSSDYGTDSGYVALPMKVLGEKYEASTTEFISVESDGTYTFYEKLYKYVTYDNVNWKITSEYIQGEVLSATLVENGTMCDAKNEYKRMEYVIDKYSIQTNIFTKGNLITENSENCQIDITAKFNVTSTTSNTKICNSAATSSFTYMFVDGEQIDVTSGYTFNTTGEHEVQYIMSDKTTIGEETFSGCISLTSITIPDSVTDIGGYAFRSCESLTSVTFPESVTSIRRFTLAYCSSLTSFTIPNSVRFIDTSAFYECSGLTSVSIGSGVTSIGDNAFYKCTSLTSIVIPNSVTKIGYPFRKCSGLTSVTIGSGVTTIDNWAFEDCIRLTSITCYATTAPTLSSDVFINLPSSGTLHIPQGSDYSTWLSQLGSGWTIQYIT